MVRELRLAVGHETGDEYAVFLDLEGSEGDSPFDYGRLATLAGVDVTGVVRLVPVADSDTEWSMDVRNIDGSAAPNSDNGIRVASAFMVSQNMVASANGDRFTIGTRDGVKDVQVGSGGLVRVDLGRWKFGNRESHVCDVLLGGLHTVTVLSSVVELENLDAPSDLPTTEGNAEWVFVAAEEQLIDDGIGRLRYRIVRPGVGEVASSGSGAATAALVMRHTTGARSTHNWRAESTGGSIGVQMFPTEEGEHVGIHGHAEMTHVHTITI
jgi:diaminopimelate epimerase